MYRKSVNPKTAAPHKQRIDWKKLAENSPNISEKVDETISESFLKTPSNVPL